MVNTVTDEHRLHSSISTHVNTVNVRRTQANTTLLLKNRRTLPDINLSFYKESEMQQIPTGIHTTVAIIYTADMGEVHVMYT